MNYEKYVSSICLSRRFSASTEPNDSQFIEWDKHQLSYVIELDDYVSIRFFVS